MFIRWKKEAGPTCRAVLVESRRTLSGPRLSMSPISAHSRKPTSLKTAHAHGSGNPFASGSINWGSAERSLAASGRKSKPRLRSASRQQHRGKRSRNSNPNVMFVAAVPGRDGRGVRYALNSRTCRDYCSRSVKCLPP